MVDAFLNKKYKLASSENFDEFMKVLGKKKLYTYFFVILSIFLALFIYIYLTTYYFFIIITSTAFFPM